MTLVQPKNVILETPNCKRNCNADEEIEIVLCNTGSDTVRLLRIKLNVKSIPERI